MQYIRIMPTTHSMVSRLGLSLLIVFSEFVVWCREQHANKLYNQPIYVAVRDVLPRSLARAKLFPEYHSHRRELMENTEWGNCGEVVPVMRTSIFSSAQVKAKYYHHRKQSVQTGYLPLTNCTILLDAGKGHKVMLRFMQLNLQKADLSKCSDALTISNIDLSARSGHATYKTEIMTTRTIFGTTLQPSKEWNQSETIENNTHNDDNFTDANISSNETEPKNYGREDSESGSGSGEINTDISSTTPPYGSIQQAGCHRRLGYCKICGDLIDVSDVLNEFGEEYDLEKENPAIISRTRYLKLHFTSDATVQLGGFVVYATKLRAAASASATPEPISSGSGDDTLPLDVSSCNKREFFCDESYWCVPRYYKCNGQKECRYGEDERSCHKSKPPGKIEILDKTLRKQLGFGIEVITLIAILGFILLCLIAVALYRCYCRRARLDATEAASIEDEETEEKCRMTRMQDITDDLHKKHLCNKISENLQDSPQFQLQAERYQNV